MIEGHSLNENEGLHCVVCNDYAVAGIILWATTSNGTAFALCRSCATELSEKLREVVEHD